MKEHENFGNKKSCKRPEQCDFPSSAQRNQYRINQEISLMLVHTTCFADAKPPTSTAVCNATREPTRKRWSDHFHRRGGNAVFLLSAAAPFYQPSVPTVFVGKLSPRIHNALRFERVNLHSDLSVATLSVCLRPLSVDKWNCP